MKYFSYLFFLSIFFSFPIAAQESSPNSDLLPQNFQVYILEGNGVINHPYNGALPTTLPTINAFQGTPGCYVACYSRNQQHSIYSVGGGIYVMGQVRVPGRYAQRICLPTDFERTDISAEESFKQLCEQYFPYACEGLSCWTGGDTGGWFGIQ